MCHLFWFRVSRNCKNFAQILISCFAKFREIWGKFHETRNLKCSRNYENENFRSHPSRHCYRRPKKAMLESGYEWYIWSGKIININTDLDHCWKGYEWYYCISNSQPAAAVLKKTMLQQAKKMYGKPFLHPKTAFINKQFKNLKKQKQKQVPIHHWLDFHFNYLIIFWKKKKKKNYG